MSELPVVPFGKYKGKPITDLIADKSYVEWCKQQDWFKKFPNVYNIVVHQTIQSNTNSKTPEHNKIQNMFLSIDNMIKFIKYTYNNKPYFKYKTQLFHSLDNDVISDKENRYVMFESMFNWDVCIDGGNISYMKWKKLVCCEDKENGCSKDCFYDNDDNDRYIQSIFIEIKPIVGDDYPNILRKMKQQIELTNNKLQRDKEKELQEWGYDCKSEQKIIYGKYAKQIKYIFNNPQLYIGDYYLFIKKYESTITTKEQLIEIFKQSNITVIFFDDVFEELGASIVGTSIVDVSDKPLNIIDDNTRITQLEKRVDMLEKIIEKLIHSSINYIKNEE